MNHHYLHLSVTGKNKYTPQIPTHPRDASHLPYFIGKWCNRINGMNHITLNLSVRGVYKYRHTRLARYAPHIPGAGCRGVSPYDVRYM